ncbi:phage baseplate protein [Alteromonadaceae bacterium M269]|nr:phage baseplate protein [Alteromonadaceae bacterium M269]
MLTTPLNAREKRPNVGSRVREEMNKNVSDSTLSRIQAFALEAFYTPELRDFSPNQCIATRTKDGVILRFSGFYQGTAQSFEVPISEHLPASEPVT